MSSIWSTLNKKEKQIQESKLPIQIELTEEIKEFRIQKKEFNATNETETFVVLCFSTIADRKEFMQNVLPKKIDEFYIDGYEFAKSIGKMPDRPKFKLKKPLQ